MRRGYPVHSNGVNRFTGHSERYHRFRPEPPEQIYQTLVKLYDNPALETVVDLGCGTGISTLPWTKYSRQVLGVDPSDNMISEAIKQHSADQRLSFQKGYGHAIPVAPESVDILTCSSSVHWMEPDSTFNEIARVLKPLGVFAAFGPQVPITPLGSYKAAAALRTFLNQVIAIDNAIENRQKPDVWKWKEIDAHMKQSGLFCYTDELCFHTTVEWDAEAFCGWVLTFSYVNALIGQNREVANDFKKFEQIVKGVFGSGKLDCLICYRLLLGIRPG